MNEIISLVFIIGYIAITVEHKIGLNKAASALITGVVCWVIFILGNGNFEEVNKNLNEHLSGIASILFFLLSAMTIVLTIEAYDGFSIITNSILFRNKKKLLWLLSIITFFLSATLDNLTTTIVMVSLLRGLIKEKEERLLFAGIIVVAANAGGAWTPIGDVTTTMLWIGGQITTFNIMKALFIPSLVCLILPVFIISLKLKGEFEINNIKKEDNLNDKLSIRNKKIILISGISFLILVPFFKNYTHLPPFMGNLLGLGLLSVITEIINLKQNKEIKHKLSITSLISKLDTLSLLFFLGILLSVSALETAKILSNVSNFLSSNIKFNFEIINESIIVMSIGILSAIVDNVPLVAASQGMYKLMQHPTDSFFWEFLSYSAGTGGSILVIGSAAGVTAMGMEHINFFWYLKNISWAAFLGFLAGSIVYILQYMLLFS